MGPTSAPTSATGAAQLLAEARPLLPELVALRRDLHRHPETGLHLPRTQAAVLQALDGLDLEITTGRATTSVVAVLRGGAPGPTVLLRGDMDALPVAELAEVDYASTNGAMHACGHDLHTAGLVGAARLLHGRRDTLAGDVVFMFQPGEEGHDGAQVMLDEGLLDASGDMPVAAFAVHVGPGEQGRFITRPGPILAGAAEFRIVVHGSGGHGSQPHSARDPVPAAAQMVAALQTMAARRFPAFDPVVLSVTRMRAGDALNVIPGTAELAGTIRMVSPEAEAVLPRAVGEVAESIAAAHGCTVEASVEPVVPVTVNDPEETAAVMTDLEELSDVGAVMRLPDPTMGSEDFAKILDRVPGTYVFLSAGPADPPESAVGAINHSPWVVFDDSVLCTQSAVLALLAARALERHGPSRIRPRPRT